MSIDDPGFESKLTVTLWNTDVSLIGQTKEFTLKIENTYPVVQTKDMEEGLSKIKLKYLCNVSQYLEF